MVIIVYKFFFVWLLLLSIFSDVFAVDTVFDDVELRKTLEEKLDSLNRENQFPDISLLYDQLERKQTSVALSKTKTKSLSLSDLYKKSCSGVLMIARGYKSKSTNKWQTSIASGFIINKQGIAVTNYHVMEPARGSVMAAMTLDKKVYPVLEILAADKAKDVAIIKLKGDNFEPLSFSTANEVGKEIAVISHPDGRFYSLSTGIISRHYIDYDKDMKAHRFAVSADFAKGSSGGPVLDNKGNVVGMVSSTRSIYYNQTSGVDENLQMVIKNCVPAQSILQLMKDSKK